MMVAATQRNARPVFSVQVQVLAQAMWPLLLITGCGEPVSELTIATPGVIECTDPRLLRGQSVPGMSVTRSVVLRSRLPFTLTNIRPVSSCGCTLAELQETRLEPNDSAVLKCRYDEREHAAGSASVAIRLFSPELSNGPLVIGFSFSAQSSDQDLRLTASPPVISVDEPWRVEGKRQYRVRLNLGRDVAPESLRVASSAEYLSVTYAGSELHVELNSPPPGSLDETVVVAFTRGSDEYQLTVPVRGRIGTPLTVTPAQLTVGRHPSGKPERATFCIESMESDPAAPLVTVDGDWLLAGLRKTEDGTWLGVIEPTVDAVGNEFPFGRISVQHHRAVRPIIVPVTGVPRPAID